MHVPFNRPLMAGREHEYIDEALRRGQLSGNGEFARRASAWLRDYAGVSGALIVPSCTAALEMTALVGDIGPGDEVILPSFTFVSTANAFALRGAIPVFVDVDPLTLNVSPTAVADAVTPRTKAIVVVHYAGVACEMDTICAVAEEHGLLLVEDAAHALPATFHGRPLGSIGHLSTLSFHETKNVQCGEGGALLVNDESLLARAEIVQEKGTDRSRFFRGEIDKYTWQEVGSSYLLSEVASAFLLAQLQAIQDITARRRSVWERYHEGLAELETAERLTRPHVPTGCEHSGHLYYLLMPTTEDRDGMIAALRDRGVHSVFHYVPLHDSPAGRRLGRAHGDLAVTTDASARLLRLPLWPGLEPGQVEHVIESIHDAVTAIR